LRASLWRNYHELAEKLRCSNPESPRSAIVPVIVGEEQQAVSLSESLAEKGFLVPAIRFPTVPRGSARLRVTLSAAHELQQIADLRNAFDSLVQR
jgi:8-amino-7-oxononanoate synthase